uniref:Low density lipoprotein receptorrelated protein 2 [Equus caballus] n=2 Tax=Lepeophtheirus salmonis TaxID=72036 RepID=A0A0K2U1E7_LEPSM
MKEWVCSKIDRPNGQVIRDCMQLYTGGEAFRVCYTNDEHGSTCLCSAELCNGSRGSHLQLPIQILNALTLVVLFILSDFFS